jgi:glucose dehydrogenase
VYIPLEDRRIVALEINNGQFVWNRRVGGPPNEILVLDDRIYFGTTDNFLYCLKADTGLIDWRWRTGGDVIGQPVADDRRVYFVSLDNMLRALDRRGGTQQWKRGLPFRPRTGPVLVNETLIVTGFSPTVHGYSAQTGAPAGDLTLTSDPAAPIHIIAGRVAPLLIAVTSDILKGATVLAFTHDVEPKVLPIAPLPNPTKESIPQTPPSSPPPEAIQGNPVPVPR